jgi:hypothetical protein
MKIENDPIDIYHLKVGDVFLEDDGFGETYEVLSFEKPDDHWIYGEVVAKSLKTEEVIGFAYNDQTYAPVYRVIK